LLGRPHPAGKQSAGLPTPRDLPLAALLVEGRLRRSLSLNEVAARVQQAAKDDGRSAALPDSARARIEVATYDETLRFNLLLVDGRIGVVQPYLHGSRGVDSPSFVLRRRHAEGGLLSIFEQEFEWLWERRTPAC